MEGKKPTASSSSSSSRIADDLFGRKEAAASSASSSSASSGYFSSVFPPASSVVGKDSAHSDLYWTLDKQRTEGRIGNAQSSRADDKCQGRPSKSHNTSNKDGKSAYPIESTESSYFGSSIHYGGREFYSSSPSMQSSGAYNNYKNNGEDDLGDSNVATRGDWWQGSLYY
ncbi:uncharacterized protein LOC103704108 isoform X2 [Phoenix dactylifera]|uniref:Uncharacterized protein LOC103704108 isoform X2 n=1 Tax=Phoenix dactylifera TaxID=42345 RepID=A0A8B7BU88_PHODC|nr:uncharacterized protein LOC103704108 isoform X2 [Phoenix dactylifera]XP_008785485.1 uncharacterized protein LOC103704108 isoform X2 [Phoenix dactylifera]